MFQQLIASNATTPRKPLTWVLSALIHGLLILLLIAVPLVHPETLANLQTLIAPPPPLSAPRKALVKLISTGKPRQVAARPSTLFTPDFIPSRINLFAPEPPEVGGDSDGISQVGLPIGGSGGSSTFLDGFSREAPRAFLPPESAVSVAQAETHVTRIERGGEVQHANLVRKVKPSYPHTAIIMRIQGTVILEAIIDREGRVENLKVLSGHPLLIPAAFEAVQQWRYRPTLLNGQPVEVVTQVTVNFSLGAP